MQTSSQNSPTKLPNVNVALFLNICSLFICYFIGLGLITGLLSVFLLRKDKQIIRLNANISNLKSYKLAWVTTWLVLLINALYFAFWVWLIGTLGWENITDPEVLSDPHFIKNAMRK